MQRMQNKAQQNWTKQTNLRNKTTVFMDSYFYFVTEKQK